MKARLKERGLKPGRSGHAAETLRGHVHAHPAGVTRSTTTGSGDTRARLTRSGSSRTCRLPAPRCRRPGPPFGLGICGWGWTAGNFPSLDKALPKDIVFSAISMSTGHAPVSENFGRLEGRQKWAIPWFEDDGALTSIQLRAGRMRRDAVDARRYGCNGLMGLHWRTRIIAPEHRSARAGRLGTGRVEPATAARRQEARRRSLRRPDGGLSSTTRSPAPTSSRSIRPSASICAATGSPCRTATYKVTLRFVEPAYKEAGKRVFGVKLQGQASRRSISTSSRRSASSLRWT